MEGENYVGANSVTGIAASQHLAWVIPFILCFCIALGCVAFLHGAPTRTTVAWLPAWTWAWGALALFSGWQLRKQRLSLTVLLVMSLSMRLIFVGSPLWLSDDVYRYVWEGLMILDGQNPFITPPSQVFGLDDALRDQVNHPSIPSAYPPGALAWFIGLAALNTEAVGAQFTAALADVATVVAIWIWCKDRPVWPAVVYALHPLAVLESANGAHLEALAVAFTAWAVVFWRKSSSFGVFLAILGSGTKLMPLLFLPSFFSKKRLASDSFAIIAGAALLSLAALPVVSAGPDLFFGIQNYATHWSFNGLIYPWLEPIFGSIWYRRIGFAAGGITVLSVWVFAHGRPATAWLICAIAFTALTPTMHPWYGLWFLIPSLLCRSWSGAVAGISLLGGYSVLATFDASSGRWTETPSLWALTWTPALVAVSIEIYWFCRRLWTDSTKA